MQDILKHIELFEFFNAFKKLDKLLPNDPAYLQLKKAFNHGKYAPDFPERLKTFVLSLNTTTEHPQVQDPPLPIATTPIPTQSATKKQILFLSANPKDTVLLNLNKEYNEIKEEARGAAAQVEMDIVLDVNRDSLSLVLNEYQPTILHFSGHGDADGLFFYGDSGYSEEVAIAAFAKLLRHYDNLELVFLNACYSEQQSAAVAQYIPFVIGIQGAIQDEKALLFSTRFYRHLFAGCSYREAFTRASDEVALYNMEDQFVLYEDGKRVEE